MLENPPTKPKKNIIFLTVTTSSLALRLLVEQGFTNSISLNPNYLLISKLYHIFNQPLLID